MGLIKTALKTAVAVRTAHFVHDRIQRRQQEEWTSGTPDAGPTPVPDTIAMLDRLDDLRSRGVLSEAEFEAQKARVLGR